MIRTKDVSLFYIAAITMKAEAAFTAVNHLPYSCLSFSAIENLFVDADRPSGIRSTVPLPDRWDFRPLRRNCSPISRYEIDPSRPQDVLNRYYCMH